MSSIDIIKSSYISIRTVDTFFTFMLSIVRIRKEKIHAKLSVIHVAPRNRYWQTNRGQLLGVKTLWFCNESLDF